MTTQKTNNQTENYFDNHREIKEFAKYAYGAFLIGSGFITFTGGGLVGGFLKSRDMMGVAHLIGKKTNRKR